MLLYSYRISGTTSAPVNWSNSEPSPIAFRPPFPEEHEIRAAKLFEKEKLERTAKPSININKLQNHNHISIICCPGASVRYTIDGSLPSDLTGKFYEKPFIVPSEADFIIKAVAFMEGKRESEVVCSSVQSGSLVAPGRFEHVAERPVHLVTSRAPLSLGLELSPWSSSHHSSDDDNESVPVFSSFNK